MHKSRAAACMVVQLKCLLSICGASAGAVELRNALSQAFALVLSATVTFDHPTVAALAGHIAGGQLIHCT